MPKHEQFERDDEGETAQDIAARQLASVNNIIVSRIKRRLKLLDERAIFIRVLSEIGSGQFEGFDAPSGNVMRPRDESITIKAFDMDKAEAHEILGQNINFAHVSPLSQGTPEKTCTFPSFPSTQSQDVGEEVFRNGDLGHLECNVAIRADDLRADLDQLLPQAGQRPILDRLRRRQRAQEIAEIVGQRVKLKSNSVGRELSIGFQIWCWPVLTISGRF